MYSWNVPTLPVLDGQGPALKLWDTSQNAEVTVEPKDKAGLYVCGITPYDATHMGHAATYVAFDLLVRFWRDYGLDVHYVQNVTDVDDPLLERARRTGVDWRGLAEDQIQLFREDMQALNVIPPREYVGAVESVPLIVDGVERLLEAGLAYRVPGGGGEPDGDIYFDLHAAEKVSPQIPGEKWTLGSVSGYDRELMLALSAERGGDPERPGKRDPLDPLLWRVHREFEPSWDGGLLGWGRPGWHIECSLIARRFLPQPFTVQAGGSDLRFPHHEMSAAHAYAADGFELAHHYAHSGMVGLNGEKMSKSKGNLVFVSSLRKQGVDPMAIRLALLSKPYRQDWSWSKELLSQAQDRLARWRIALRGPSSLTEKDADELISQIRMALSQDLDAPQALEHIDRMIVDQPQSRGVSSEGSSVKKPTHLAQNRVREAIDALLGVRI